MTATCAASPILVGTVSIEKSERLSELLDAHEYEEDGKTKRGVPHNVLNARFHEQEAAIVADAGVGGAVTIATNMAGRGTDIQLGGNVEMRVAKWRGEQIAMGTEPTSEATLAYHHEVEAEIADKKNAALAAGGLFVLGTERHESRRIDNQLRGRTGRQGDPGHSKFFLSCEDDLLRIFAGERLDAIMRTFGVAEGEAITHKWLNGAIATAQRKVEARNYEIRKNLLKYDDVVNDQRKAVPSNSGRNSWRRSDLSEVVARKCGTTPSPTSCQPSPAAQTVRRTMGHRRPPGTAAEFFLDMDLPVQEWAAERGRHSGGDLRATHHRSRRDLRAAQRETEIGAGADARPREERFCFR